MMEESISIELNSSVEENNKHHEVQPTYHEILHEIGEFGLFQILIALISGFSCAYGSIVTMNFIFSGEVIDHSKCRYSWFFNWICRCWISECESIHSSDFDTNWLEYAIPHKGGQPDPCTRYEFIGSGDGSCTERNFNRSQIIACDDFIMKNNEQRLISHLHMVCQGNYDQLTLLGTANMLGRTLAMPVSGFLSDKFGRLIIITVSSTLGAIFSVLQTLPSHLMTFELYLTFEFLASLLSTGIIAAGYILIMEWTTSKYRVHIVSISMITEALLPYLIISWAAWYFSDDFILYRLTLAMIGFLMIAFHFIIAESPQWLFAQNKHGQAIQSISKAAKINRKTLHLHTIQRVTQLSTMSLKESTDNEKALNVSLIDLLRQKTLAVRLLVVSLVWVSMYFSYYGIFFESTKVHDNKYLSFTLIGLAEVPGNFLNQLILNRIGRRWSISLTLFIFSTMLFGFTQLPADQETIHLILVAIGKVAITAACVGFHTFSTEFWPTSIRGTATNISRTAGQMGGILASVAVILRNYHAHLPLFLSTAAGLFAIFLVLIFLPETMYCGKLPDTIEEALQIGRTKETKNSE